MMYQLRYRMMEFARASRRAILPCLIALSALYFGLYAVLGPKGFQVLHEREADLALASAELSMLKEEQEALEKRVSLLNGRAVDRDLLEEEARRTLNMAHPNEVIVLMQSANPATGRAKTAEAGKTERPQK
jgi:cell division protein FtsB